jgi:hypothetical protein
MSIEVALDELQSTIDSYTFCYVITVGTDARAHVVAVTPRWEAGDLVLVAGRSSRSNASDHASVTLCFPPVDDGGFSLIVDATADVREEELVLAPVRAVLHRPAPGMGG